MGVESIFLAPSPQAGADILLGSELTAENAGAISANLLALYASDDVVSFLQRLQDGKLAAMSAEQRLNTTRQLAQYIARVPAGIWAQYQLVRGAVSFGRSQPTATRFADPSTFAHLFSSSTIRPKQRLTPDGRVAVVMEASGKKAPATVTTALAVPDTTLLTTQGGLFQPSRRSAVFLNMVLREGRKHVDSVHTVLTGTIPFRQQPVHGWTDTERMEYALLDLDGELKGFAQRRRLGIPSYDPFFIIDPRDEGGGAMNADIAQIISRSTLVNPLDGHDDFVISKLDRFLFSIAHGSDARQLTLVYVHALGEENGFGTYNNGMLDPTIAPVTTITYSDLFARLDRVPGKKVLILNIFMHQADAVRHLQQWPRRGDYALVTTREPSREQSHDDVDVVFSPSSLATVLQRGTPLSRFRARWPRNELKLELLLGNFDVIP